MRIERRELLRRGLVLAAPWLLAGCAGNRLAVAASSRASEATEAAKTSEAPLLALNPASLGQSLALQQQLSVYAHGQVQHMDVLLEADPKAVRLAVITLGQIAARLEWDGTTMTAFSAPWWPAAVPAQYILSDLQLMLWPAAAINGALAAGWHLDEAGAMRTLMQGADAVIQVVRSSPSSSRLEHLRKGYRIEVESRPMGSAP